MNPLLNCLLPCWKRCLRRDSKVSSATVVRIRAKYQHSFSDLPHTTTIKPEIRHSFTLRKPSYPVEPESAVQKRNLPLHRYVFPRKLKSKPFN